MTQVQSRIGPLQIGIILLAVATAAIHIWLAVAEMDFDLLFIANGVGYLALVAALYAPLPALAPYRNSVRWVLIAYTAVTVVLWLLIGARTLIAYIDKAIEIGLLLLLWMEGQAARRR
ncbi:MAG TPA: hypothetical protein VNK95_12765 [Caldilineaceae bacterium]|nr:hypothetical protein [Caldilineaceae bacterium]